jgi:exosome complex exonuclease DIS3/RRP44
MVEITIRKRPLEDAIVTQRKFFKKTARGKVIKGVYRHTGVAQK